jgi:ribosomal protein S18 acetylase RimI-like enzyme
MGFRIVRDIDEDKLTELLCGDGGFDSIYDIYEAGAPDLLQMAAVDDLSGDYVGFISCTVPDGTEFALLEAYVSTDFRHNGIFTLMYKSVGNELAKLCGGNCPAIVVSMDDDTFEMLKNSSLRPTLHSTEYLYGIDREHYEERHENNSLCYQTMKDGANNCLCHLVMEQETDDHLCFQAVDGDDFIIGELFLDLSETKACINDVWVDEDCRKKGVATALVSHTLNNYFSSKDTADNTVILHVTGSNTAAVRLYKKCGFFELECVKYYSLPYLL